MSLKKYYWVYLRVYVLSNLVLLAISMLVDLGSSLSFLTVFFSAIITGQQFVRHQRRAPSPQEKKRLVWISLMTSWGISTLFTILILALSRKDMAVFGQMLHARKMMAFVVGVLAILFVVSYAMTSWAYGGMLKGMTKKINKPVKSPSKNSLLK